MGTKSSVPTVSKISTAQKKLLAKLIKSRIMSVLPT